MNYDLKVALNLLVPGTGFVEDDFCIGGVEGLFWDDSGALHLLCTLFLLSLCRPHPRSSGIRSLRLGSPVLKSSQGREFRANQLDPEFWVHSIGCLLSNTNVDTSFLTW